jgi:hypothetical protein
VTPATWIGALADPLARQQGLPAPSVQTQLPDLDRIGPSMSGTSVTVPDPRPVSVTASEGTTISVRVCQAIAYVTAFGSSQMPSA